MDRCLLPINLLRLRELLHTFDRVSGSTSHMALEAMAGRF